MHESVLLSEAIDLLKINPEGLYLDATAGAGGHAAEILKQLSPRGRLIVADCDPVAVDRVKQKFSFDGRVNVIHARFSELFDFLKEKNERPLDGLLADLGVSSPQLEDPERGIGFLADGPLDMRLDPRREETAADLVMSFSDVELADLIFKWGEERHSRRLARHIVSEREKEEIRTTGQLKAIAERAIGRFYRGMRIHPATRLFQALRIAVNHEMEELDSLLNTMPPLLAPAGRMAIISFHSLEDRKVKQKFVALKGEGWNLLTKKPVVPSDEESKRNPRSRSAKLRVIERV